MPTAVGPTSAPATPSAAPKYPLEERPWLRTFLIGVACAVCTGVLSGEPLFIQLFIDAGVGSSACGGDDGGTCDEQYLAVTKAFTTGSGLGIIASTFAGLLFDRYGGNLVSRLGAGMVCVGFAVVQAPLLGAYYGKDGQTFGLLVWALLLLDTGCMLNSYSLFAMVWHLPKYQTFIAAAAQAANSFTALLPVFLSMVIRRTGMPLHSIFLLWLGFAALGYVTCHVLVPTQAEFRAQAKKAMGVAPPRGDRISLWRQLKQGFAVLRLRLGRHLLCILSAGAALCGVGNYMMMLPDYARLLFKSTDTGHYLSSVFSVCFGFVGCVIGPFIAYLGDANDHGMLVLLASLVVSSAALSACIAKPTLLAQEVCCLAAAVWMNFYSVLLPKYAMAYAMPSRFGVVAALVVFLTMLGAIPFLVLTYSWIAFLPSTSLEHLRVPLQGVSLLGTAAFVLWAAQFVYFGVPKSPDMLPGEEEEAALAFGCQSFEEVAAATGLDRPEVVRRLSKGSADDMRDLVERLDLSRLESPLTSAKTSRPGSEDSSDAASSSSSGAAESESEEEEDDDDGSDGARDDGSPAAARVGGEEGGMAVQESWYVPPEPAASPLFGEVTLCAISCHSGGGGGGGAGEVQSSRCDWSGSSLAALLGCCAADPRPRVMLQDARVPLLQKQHAAPRKPKEAAAPDPKKKAREFNEKTMEMMRSKDKEGILRLYETSDPQLLYDAYLDMYDMFDKETLDRIEEEFSDVVPDDELSKLAQKRTELRIVFAKMMAHRVKTSMLG